MRFDPYYDGTQTYEDEPDPYDVLGVVRNGTVDERSRALDDLTAVDTWQVIESLRSIITAVANTETDPRVLADLAIEMVQAMATEVNAEADDE